jgi:membrane-associated protein
MIAELYAMIPRHGASVLFLAALMGCAGAPIPTSALMLAAGAFVASGDMHFLPVFLAALLGAVLGDQIGYAAGRFGGQPLWARLHAKPSFAPLMDRARDHLTHRAVMAVVISRFPLSALGPAVNLAAGATGITWLRFSAGVLVGDLIWILIYLGGGSFFADKVRQMGSTMTSVVLSLSALALAVWLGRHILRHRDPHHVT